MTKLMEKLKRARADKKIAKIMKREWPKEQKRIERIIDRKFKKKHGASQRSIIKAIDILNSIRVRDGILYENERNRILAHAQNKLWEIWHDRSDIFLKFIKEEYKPKVSIRRKK